MAETITAHEITITRVYDAPRRLVWEAWTNPDRLAQWWGKRGWRAQRSSIVMDVRPGGRFSVNTVSDADGSEMTSDAVYREVAEPERLVFTEAPAAGCAESEGTVGTVTFADLGDGRTEMVFRSTLYTTDENRERTVGGLNSAFDRLAETLEQR